MARFVAKFVEKAKLFVDKGFSALATVPNKYCLTFEQVGNVIDCGGSDENKTTAAGELLAKYIEEYINLCQRPINDNMAISFKSHTNYESIPCFT
ncbi:hypothetical protein VKT23_000291 [Stygiomarasmius scandens]|uniref:Uncharacterized protein n=1 Tax=Marasmiellus scandens TaxID=2682957 RepID=A0ABR1K418_9AGAR